MNQSISRFAQLIGDKLQQLNLTITCAESCTGGGLAYALTGVAGSSAWFNQSAVTYSNQAKQTLLGVSSRTLIAHGAVSEQTVSEMAKGAATLAHANMAISISGIAGPGGGTPDKPVGTVWFGFALEAEVQTRHQVFSGDREQVRLEAIQFALAEALNLLALYGES
jgi:nicotinamide-nucleotide amidase